MIDRGDRADRARPEGYGGYDDGYATYDQRPYGTGDRPADGYGAGDDYDDDGQAPAYGDDGYGYRDNGYRDNGYGDRAGGAPAHGYDRPDTGTYGTAGGTSGFADGFGVPEAPATRPGPNGFAPPPPADYAGRPARPWPAEARHDDAGYSGAPGPAYADEYDNGYGAAPGPAYADEYDDGYGDAPGSTYADEYDDGYDEYEDEDDGYGAAPSGYAPAGPAPYGAPAPGPSGYAPAPPVAPGPAPWSGSVDPAGRAVPGYDGGSYDDGYGDEYEDDGYEDDDGPWDDGYAEAPYAERPYGDAPYADHDDGYGTDGYADDGAGGYAPTVDGGYDAGPPPGWAPAAYADAQGYAADAQSYAPDDRGYGSPGQDVGPPPGATGVPGPGPGQWIYSTGEVPTVGAGAARATTTTSPRPPAPPFPGDHGNAPAPHPPGAPGGAPTATAAVPAVRPSTAIVPMAQAAQILDRGYRNYDGPRTGRNAAMRSVFGQTLRRALGLRRGPSAKAFPVFAGFLAYLPAIVFIGMVAVVKEKSPTDLARFTAQYMPSMAWYYGYIEAAIVIFVAFVAPEVLCTDRRNGMLGLYFASPLDRTRYLLAKAAGVAAAMSVVTVGPPLLFLLGRTLNDQGPRGFGGFVAVLVKVLISGVIVTLPHLALSFAVSSTTTRRAEASAGIIFVLSTAWLVPGNLVKIAGVNANVLLLDILQMPLEIVSRLYPEDRGISQVWRDQIPDSLLIFAYLAWTVGFFAFAFSRYRRIQVTR